jgi:transcriptional regulator of acetoin/glycerol metabolism
LLRYREQFRSKGINPNLPRLKAEKTEQLIKRKQKNAELVQFTAAEVGPCSESVAVPHIFVLTDAEGVAIYLRYPEPIGASLTSIGLDEGVSFALCNLGINGVSMAMERQSIVVVRGAEHDIKLFTDWTCLCIPIRAHGQIRGYLDLSFHHDYDVEFAVPLLYEIVGKIEKRLMDDSQKQNKVQLSEVFNRFGLTNREKEAASGWLQNHSALRIAADMGITEGTVRNLIKSVYRKTNVNDKGNFIREFGGLI